MIDETHHVLKKQIRRLPGFSQAGQFKEESAAWISESFSGACNAESLVILNFGITSTPGDALEPGQTCRVTEIHSTLLIVEPVLTESSTH